MAVRKACVTRLEDRVESQMCSLESLAGWKGQSFAEGL